MIRRIHWRSEWLLHESCYPILTLDVRLVLRWLAVPWLQHELDLWVTTYNSTPRRSDKHKILPQGIPNMIASKPEQFATKDYKVHPTR